MRTIREVREDELEEFGRITIEAFPGMKIDSQAARERMQERLAKVRREPIAHFFGVFEDEQMVGVMRCYDFTMKLHETRALLGGLGGVAVDLRYKKEHVAADMVRYYLDFYREKGAALVALYPFRPDFYRRMGFGYGVKLNRYSFRPDALPPGDAPGRVDFLTAADREEVAACYDRFLQRTNGLLEMAPHMLDQFFADPASRLVGLRHEGELRGYMAFRFVPGAAANWLLNDIELRTLVYDDAAALGGLLAFLRKQADQVDRVIYETQDDAFHYALRDPRDGSGKLLAGLWHQSNTQGVGIMYRVIDVPRLFDVLDGHDFGGVTLRLRLNLSDSFLPQNAGSYLLAVDAGRARLESGNGAADVEIALNIEDFSSLVTGAADFANLHSYGLARLSDESYAPLVARLFRVARRPWCLHHF